MSYYLWFIIALVLFVFEIMMPGFVILWFGIGALIAGLLGFLGIDSLTVQIIAFAVSSLLLVTASRSIFKNFFIKDSPGGELKSNTQMLIGMNGVVSEQIDNSLSQGRVIIESQDWAARSADGRVIEPGEVVIILRIEGIKLIVE